MLKYLIYISVGYLIFKVVKNGVYLTLESLKKTKELKGTTELIKCDQCGGFFDSASLVNHAGKSFCSETCRQDFQNEPH